MTDSQKPLEVTATLTANKLAPGTRSVTIYMTVRNKSSHVVKSAGKWAVKDESVNPPVVQEATFNRIPPGGSDQQTVNLPTGFEWGAYKFEAEDGAGAWQSVHGGDDTELVNLNLT